jgi:cell division protein FtsW (lipid II flippase)
MVEPLGQKPRRHLVVDRRSLVFGRLPVADGAGHRASFAASPAVAERIGLDSFHFATRQIMFMMPALGACWPCRSWPRQIRALALILLGLIIAADDGRPCCSIGIEVKGARRWVSLAGVSIQPSEFMKPAFVIICAWLFAEQKRAARYPGQPASPCCCSASCWRCSSPSPTSARPC